MSHQHPSRVGRFNPSRIFKFILCCIGDQTLRIFDDEDGDLPCGDPIEPYEDELEMEDEVEMDLDEPETAPDELQMNLYEPPIIPDVPYEPKDPADLYLPQDTYDDGDVDVYVCPAPPLLPRAHHLPRARPTATDLLSLNFIYMDPLPPANHHYQYEPSLTESNAYGMSETFSNARPSVSSPSSFVVEYPFNPSQVNVCRCPVSNLVQIRFENVDGYVYYPCTAVEGLYYAEQLEQEQRDAALAQQAQRDALAQQAQQLEPFQQLEGIDFHSFEDDELPTFEKEQRAQEQFQNERQLAFQHNFPNPFLQNQLQNAALAVFPPQPITVPFHEQLPYSGPVRLERFLPKSIPAVEQSGQHYRTLDQLRQQFGVMEQSQQELQQRTRESLQLALQSPPPPQQQQQSSFQTQQQHLLALQAQQEVEQPQPLPLAQLSNSHDTFHPDQHNVATDNDDAPKKPAGRTRAFSF